MANSLRDQKQMPLPGHISIMDILFWPSFRYIVHPTWYLFIVEIEAWFETLLIPYKNHQVVITAGCSRRTHELNRPFFAART